MNPKPITINVPMTTIVALHQEIASLFEQLATELGETIPDFNLQDLGAFAHESNTLHIKTNLITGITIEINPDYLVDGLKIYGKIITAMIPASKAAVTAMMALTPEMTAFEKKWHSTGERTLDPVEVEVENVTIPVTEPLTV